MTASRSPLFLLDGNGLIYRSHLALAKRPLINQRGINVSAAQGVARFLRRFIERHESERIAMVLDGGRDYRTALYPEYKATRSGMPDDLRAALPHIETLIESLGVPLIRVPGHEADDVIGSLAEQAAMKGLETIIVASDKDFFQLVREGVKVLDPYHGPPGKTSEKLYDSNNVVDRLGVKSDQVVDYLTLVGDASDNIPGAPGIGKKTAVALLAQYGTLDEILARAGEIGGKRGETLAAFREQAPLSRTLVTILRGLDCGVKPEDLTRTRSGRRRLEGILADLELADLAKEWRLNLPARPSAAVADAPPARKAARL